MGVLGLYRPAVYFTEIRSLMSEYFKVIGMFMGALGGLFLLGIITHGPMRAGRLSAWVAWGSWCG